MTYSLVAYIMNKKNNELINPDKFSASSVLDSIAIPTFAINTQHEITHWNQAIEKASGYPASYMLGTKNQWRPFYVSSRPTMADLIVDGGNNEAVEKFYTQKYRKSEVLDDAYEAEDYFPDMGNGEWLSFTAAPILNANNEVIGAVETLIVVSDKKKTEQALIDSQQRYRELSTIDDLTQLLNARQFFSTIKEEVEKSNRYGEALTICLFDLDHFKNINDTYGHQFGNTVLKQYAAIIKSNIRDVDIAFRYGGEEFVTIFPFLNAEQATIAVDRIRVELENFNFKTEQNETVKITTSAGIATHIPKETQESLVNRADQAMYLAKENGRNRITIAANNPQHV